MATKTEKVRTFKRDTRVHIADRSAGVEGNKMLHVAKCGAVGSYTSEDQLAERAATCEHCLARWATEQFQAGQVEFYRASEQRCEDHRQVQERRTKRTQTRQAAIEENLRRMAGART